MPLKVRRFCFHMPAHNRKDLSGRQFTNLTAIERIGTKGGKSLWRCRCVCGATVITGVGNLTSGNTKSCGCIRKVTCRKGALAGAAAVRMPSGLAARASLLSRYKRQARYRSILWSLADAVAVGLFSEPCFYCGDLPNMTVGDERCHRFNGAFTYNGIDRLDPSVGYVDGNVAPCCGECNFMKRSLTKERFFQKIEKIHSRQTETMT